MPENQLPTVPTADPDAPTLKAALDSQRDILEKMTAAEIDTPLNLDAAFATRIVSGSLRRIFSLRAEIEHQFGAAGVAIVDALPTVTYATRQACIEHDVADTASELRAQNERVLEDHELLECDADALAARKLIERSRIEPGRPIQGYRTAAVYPFTGCSDGDRVTTDTRRGSTWGRGHDRLHA